MSECTNRGITTQNKETTKRKADRQKRKEGRKRETMRERKRRGKREKDKRERERERKEKKERENLVGFTRVHIDRIGEELTAAGQHRRSIDVAADQVGEG